MNAQQRRNLRRYQAQHTHTSVFVVMVKCVGCRPGRAERHPRTIAEFERFGKLYRGHACEACLTEVRHGPANHAIWPQGHLGETDAQQARLLRRLRR